MAKLEKYLNTAVDGMWIASKKGMPQYIVDIEGSKPVNPHPVIDEVLKVYSLPFVLTLTFYGLHFCWIIEKSHIGYFIKEVH